ncbi:VOC family protein [Mucilaginibacter polytrichastri]|nr:VOC family protein [Mucilaginibacter polytrichastri]
MEINRLDHLVLTVADVDATCKFYSEVLGMVVETFGDNRKALKFGNQKINLHQKGNEIDPKANRPTPGSADLCFITDTPIARVEQELIGKGLNLIASRVERTGATGKIVSIYFRDPDLNLIEVSNYL